MEILQKAMGSLGTFDFEVAGLAFEPNYAQALAIVFLLFILILTLARLRRLFLRWSLGGWYAWFFMGFLMTLVLEGFLLIGGKTILIEVLGWENAPKPVGIILDSGRNKLVDVLGATDEVITSDEVVAIYQTLDSDEASVAHAAICQQDTPIEP